MDGVERRDGGERGEVDLEVEALGTLVEALLEKARGRTWDVLRTAYRELSLRTAPGPSGSVKGTTGEWLARSLVLRPRRLDGARSAGDGAGAGVGDKNETENGDAGKETWEVCVEEVEAWLEERGRRGEARRKEGEGMEGRWVLVKA